MIFLRRKSFETPSHLKEMELLLKCVRAHLNDETAARIRTLAGGEIDWGKLRVLANRHRVLPLLYRSLYSTCPELVPGEVLGQLRLEYHANAARSMDLTEKLIKILDLFEHQGIDVIPFKGPILAATAYGDLASRMMGDLDLFVRRGDIPAVNDLLLSQGFRSEYRLDGFARNKNLQGPGACHFIGGKTNIDLHWEIAPRIFTYNFDADGYWSRLQPVPMGRKGIPALSMEDRLLMLCGHGVRNVWSQLVWIRDIAETMQQMSPEDLDRAYIKARSLGSETILHFGLSLAHDLISVNLSENIQDHIRSDSKIDLLMHRVKKRLLRENGEFISGTEWLSSQLRVRQHLMDKVRFLWRLATTPNVDDLTQNYFSSWLSILYLFHRCVRLMGKYVLSPMATER